ncbi:dnaaf1, partial [Symbiodinium pilosum]
VSFVSGRGYVLESINEQPGQRGLEVGDLLIEVAGRSLALASEDEADEVLSAELRDGVRLRVLRPPAARSESPEARCPAHAEESPEKAISSQAGEAASGSHDALAGFLSSLFGGSSSTGGTEPNRSADPKGQGPVHQETPQADPPQSAEPPNRQTSDGAEEILATSPSPFALELVPPELDTEGWQAPAPSPEVVQENTPGQDVAPKPDPEEDAEEVMIFEPLHSSRATEQQDAPAESMPESSPPLPALAWSKRADPAEADAVDSQSEVSASRSEMVVAAAPPLPTLAAPSTKRSSTAAGPRCKVSELRDWLEELRLEEYLDAASTWCAEMGAVSLEEIAENIE